MLSANKTGKQECSVLLLRTRTSSPRWEPNPVYFTCFAHYLAHTQLPCMIEYNTETLSKTWKLERNSITFLCNRTHFFQQGTGRLPAIVKYNKQINTCNTHHKHKDPTLIPTKSYILKSLISMTRTLFDNSFYQIVDGISFFSHSSYAPWGPMNLSLLRFVVIKSWSEHIFLANMNLNLKVSQHPQLLISHHYITIFLPLLFWLNHRNDL